MKKLTLFAILFAAICSFSIAPAVADDGALQLFDASGTLRWDNTTGHNTLPAHVRGTLAGNSGAHKAKTLPPCHIKK